MSRISFTQLSTGTPAVDQVQGYIATALNPLFQLPFASGNRVQDVEISLAGTNVAHGLEQAPEGWIVLKTDSPQVIYQSSVINDFPDEQIILKAARVPAWEDNTGGIVTVDIFFF